MLKGVLMDKGSISFQMFLTLLSIIAVGSESQISVDQVTLYYSSNVKVILRWLFGFFLGGGGGGWAFSEAKILHMALSSVQFLASFISFCFEVLSYLACGEKIIKLAYKNSVKLGEKSTSDF